MIQDPLLNKKIVDEQAAPQAIAQEFRKQTPTHVPPSLSLTVSTLALALAAAVRELVTSTAAGQTSDENRTEENRGTGGESGAEKCHRSRHYCCSFVRKEE